MINKLNSQQVQAVDISPENIKPTTIIKVQYVKNAGPADQLTSNQLRSQSI